MLYPTDLNSWYNHYPMEEVVTIKAVVKPTQFMSRNEQGKTNSCLSEMRDINKYFMNMTKVLTDSTSNRKPIHIIFTNNSLLETKQWNNKIANFGVDTMAILSSKDVKTKGEISSLIHDGDDCGRKVNYIMCCANRTRFEDIKWLVRTYSNEHPEYIFYIWLDEFDAIDDYVNLIRILKTYPKTIASFFAITATAIVKWFKMLMDCGYNATDVQLITNIVDSSEYRTISDHNLIYSDKIEHVGPVSNFKYILENPGEVCYEDTENKIKCHIPDLKSLKGKILFVPGEVFVSTHTAIKNIAIDILKANVVVLNGKEKAVFFADGRPKISLYDYKKKNKYLFNEWDSPIDVLRVIYNDPELRLKGDDNLVITGFRCIERGVTFNLPSFQFHTAIFSQYHFQGIDDIESIVQLAGRCNGWNGNVPIINIIAPKKLLDEVIAHQNRLIEFLKTSPSFIQIADMSNDPEAIPILIEITDEQLIKDLENTKKKNKKFDMITDGIKRGLIKVTNPNQPTSTREPFGHTYSAPTGKQFVYTPKTFRMCTPLTKDGKPENYRFDKFLEAYENGYGYGQGNAEGMYSVDVNFHDIWNGNERIKRGMGFISYAYKKV